MAINSNILTQNTNLPKSRCSSNTSNLSSRRLIKINFAERESSSSTKSKKYTDVKGNKSPYLSNDKIQLLSRLTQKKRVHQKPIDVTSSYPLAVNVYKANSDELKVANKGSKKVKKSVLTLPNEQAPMPKTYTVSDLNDSEYFNDANDKSKKTKKRRSVKRVKKVRSRDPEMEYYDRDARFCSQMNIDLDCSSSEIININGDGKGISKLSNKYNNPVKAENDPHDVWAVLRNINKIQFRTSPSASQESVVPLRKRTQIIKKGHNRNNDTRIIETCHTEEFSYISSFEIDSKSHDSISPSSSFDRVTVIDKQSDQDFIQRISHKIFGSSRNSHPTTRAITNKHHERIKPSLINSSKRLQKNKKKKCIDLAITHTNYDKILHGDMQSVAAPVIKNPLLPDLETVVSNKSNISMNSGNNDRNLVNDNRTFCENPSNDLTIVDQPGNDNKVCGLRATVDCLKGTKNNGHVEKQMSGITKVILSQGNDIVSTKLPDPSRKPRLALTLPNTRIPKLTQTEIKRRLANLKFPIVILGKDQLTNRGIDVANNDLPHLNGLDQHIWPYMIEWYEKKIASVNSQNSKRKYVIISKTKSPKTKYKDNYSDDLLNMDKFSQKDQDNVRNRHILRCNDVRQSTPEVPLSENKKPKPISILKSKMLQFLHKNSCPIQASEKSLHNSGRSHNQIGTSVDLNQTTYESNGGRNVTKSRAHNNEIVKTCVENKLLKNTYSSIKHPWAKTKWTSDFIENVIKKIRNGVYTIGVDRKEIQYRIWNVEVSTQTETNVLRNVSCQNSYNQDCLLEKELNEKQDPLKGIPGFDKAISTLEIETISKSKIAVKHCVTNVVVQFDIEVFAEEKNKKATFSRRSMSCTPIKQKNTQEKLFKCNTSILNSNLPAELCSIIPSMMKTLLDTEIKFSKPIAIVEKNDSHLAAISELTGFESSNMSAFLSESVVSNQLKPVLTGHYTSGNLKTKTNTKIDLHLPITAKKNIGTLLLSFSTHLLGIFNQQYNLDKTLSSFDKVMERSDSNKNILSTCMSLQPFNPNSLALIPITGFCNVYDFIKNIVKNFYLNKKLFSKVELRQRFCDNNVIIVNRPTLFDFKENQSVEMIIPKNKFGVISLYKALTASNDDYKEISSNTTISLVKDCTSNKKGTHILLDKNKISVQNKVERKKKRSVKIINKRSYVKCYRKCNSMSNISNYKNTPLSKITNIEEFCHVMGSSSLCSVLNGCSESKIIGAVEEMKNWTSEISAKQALLILLLTNKKDTPNLIRFRPVILQGIAVNRITRAVELDTEIEVIEREHFSKSLQYEGISYLPASVKNQDSLLEELYWIAKTTASDYQRTFDESSEKLLKSLLEKRKKLNPSYLRVMARYVGLGLLNPRK